VNFQHDVQIGNLTTMRLKSTTAHFAEPQSVDELREALKWAKERELPVRLLAGGSNIVFATKTFEGLVIKPALTTIEIHENMVTVFASVPINRLLLAAKEHKLSGLAPFSGLPGTMGGAVRGNAGCYGREMCEIITSVTMLNEHMELETVSSDEMRFGYRDSRIKHAQEYVVSAKLELVPSDAESIAADYKETLLKRLSRQPKGFSSGSFFKNPIPGSVFAGELIEKAKLKGFEIGDMFVSTEHANYLMNRGDASPAELLELMQHVRETVEKNSRYVLEPEVTVVT
jgi:UDP-N-acetylmuramate dehydrogenase